MDGALRRSAEFGFPPIALFVGHSYLHLLGKLHPAGRLRAVGWARRAPHKTGYFR